MELVLSPGRLGDNADNGNSFQNEEIREWSHVDRLTGMLERARIETGRWQTRNHEAAHSYGKVIDSRERNSVDGSVVQKARRQVEVFQSQGTGGRSFQVVRASQWSSSRITDSTSSSPVPISVNETHHRNEADEKLNNEDSSLTRLSRLCRQSHIETINNQSSSPPKSNSLPSANRQTDKSDVKDNSYSPGLLNNKKFTSNEDITSINEKDDAGPSTKFTRDCKARRSLQISNSNSTITNKRTLEYKDLNRMGMKLSDLDEQPKASIQSTHSIHIKKDIGSYLNKANTVSGDIDCHEDALYKFDMSARKSSNRLPKSYVLGMEKTNNEEINSSLNTNNIINHRISPLSFKEKLIKTDNDILEYETYNEYRRPIDQQLSMNRPKAIHLVPTGKVNTTVVHLSNNTSSCQENQSENIVTIRSSGIKIEPLSTSVVQCRIQSLNNRFSNKNLISNEVNADKRDNSQPLEDESVISLYRCVPSYQTTHDDMILDDTKITKPSINIIENVPDVIHNVFLDKNPVASDESVILVGRPIKKVEFCKTEVHFAADSGKVNIVETDGKPPPSNRFRRRRRNNLIGSPINKNVPLIHFGDTSYEKYIFGTSNSLENKKFISPDSNSVHKHINVEDPLKSTNLNELQEPKNEWGVKLKSILEQEYKSESNKNYESVNENLTDRKHRGHTTTVNLAANILSKIKHINQDEADLNNINKLLVKNISDTIPALNIDVPKKECIETEVICDKGPILNIRNENNVVFSDTENNQVLLKTVTTHEPIIARVENDHLPKLNKQQSNKLISDSSICKEGVKLSSNESCRTTPFSSTNSVNVKLKAKDHCDNNMMNTKKYNFNSDGSTTDPMYVNVFHSVENNMPIYENYHTVNSNINKNECSKLKYDTDTSLMEVKLNQNKTFKSRNEHSNAKCSHSNVDCSDRCFKKSSQLTKQELNTIPGTKLNDAKCCVENHKIKQMKEKSKSKGPFGSVSSASSIESIGQINEPTKNQEMKHFNDTVHNNQISKRIREKGAIAKSKSQINSSNRLSEVAINDNANKKTSDSVRSKKPIEIVHQTVVFNMKNEKLSKPWKVKESKSPRYINDLICGSKSKRPVDKRVKDTVSKLQLRSWK